MATQKNYLSLTEEQKQYVRENSTKIGIAQIARDLFTSRHEVMKVILAEGLSINVPKKPVRKKKEKDIWSKNMFI